MPDLAARLRDYERTLERLIRAGLRVEARDLARIRERFRVFARQAIALVPGNYSLNAASIPETLAFLARELDTLARDLEAILRDGFVAKASMAEELGQIAGRAWTGTVVGMSPLGATPQLLDAAMEYSAKLIGHRTGGLVGEVQRAIDLRIRLAALGAEGRTFNATSDITEILNGVRGWSYRAERIYRTEVNRLFSIATEQGVRELARHADIVKRWYWSGIDREEHARIHGQTIGPKARFRVPLRDGGSVSMKYPRDPAAPPSATVNCGCFHAAIPKEAAQLVTLPARRPAWDVRHGKRKAA